MPKRGTSHSCCKLVHVLSASVRQVSFNNFCKEIPLQQIIRKR